jgi:DNA invertase Pin-like site-specific DNA recombinase
MMKQGAEFKVAIYCRVSTQEQDTENQRIRLIEYAKQKGWQYDVYTEVQSTRKTRPVKSELIAKLRDHEYDGVLIFKLDRWARSSTELILEVKELIEKGIVFISVTDNLDFSTAAGKLHFQILSAFAEFERDLIRERTIEGIRRARLQGKQPGRPKGSKDKKKRKKAGYYLRVAKMKQKIDEECGEFKSIDTYL